MIDAQAQKQIYTLTQQHGFDAVGFARSHALETRNQNRLQEFIDTSAHGTMDWMATYIAKRKNPQTLMANAKSIIMVGVNYAPARKDCDPLAWLEDKNKASFACYALGRDYHDVLKKNLRALIGELQRAYQGEFKLYVDTAPLAEKPLGARAGLGWQGKHTNLVSKQFGSWLFLGAILTDHPLAPDAPADDACGTCQACIDICPTGAITAPYILDARKCIAYLTIEHQGSIPLEYRRAIGNRIFGCDDCLAICPWNKFAEQSHHQEFAIRSSLQDRTIANFFTWGEQDFRKNFSKSPIKRLGFTRFIRNLLIVAGNSGNRDYLPEIEKYCTHDDAMLAETANWAKREIHNKGVRHQQADDPLNPRCRKIQESR